MGVYNRLMKMPEHCKYCEWVRVDWDNIHFDGNGTVYCAPLFEPIPNDGRHKNCPLVEVKTPHGRLIDADKQFRGLQKQVMALYIERSEKYSYLMDVLDSINREPTVIEAEESE